MAIKKFFKKNQWQFITTGIFALLTTSALVPVAADAHGSYPKNCNLTLNLDHGNFQYGWGGKEMGGACKRKDGSWNWWTYVNRCKQGAYNDNGTLRCSS